MTRKCQTTQSLSPCFARVGSAWPSNRAARPEMHELLNFANVCNGKTAVWSSSCRYPCYNRALDIVGTTTRMRCVIHFTVKRLRISQIHWTLIKNWTQIRLLWLGKYSRYTCLQHFSRVSIPVHAQRDNDLPILFVCPSVQCRYCRLSKRTDASSHFLTFLVRASL